jgi:signal transduction histidine kinase
MRIEQVITNLISNAIKYGDGKPIDLKMEREDSMAKLSVQDRGIGITPKDQSQIFERFVRATDQEKKKSLGLGLFIVKQIVEAHNGKISVSSAPGQGSTFSVTLPLTRLTSTQP